MKLKNNLLVFNFLFIHPSPQFPKNDNVVLENSLTGFVLIAGKILKSLSVVENLDLTSSTIRSVWS